jgi:hypothetical protein
VAYTVDASRVVFERIDDEITLIDLETGNYYSILSSGVELWDALSRGSSIDEAADHVSAHYSVDPAVATAVAQRFADDLVAAGLLAPANGAPRGAALSRPPDGARPWQEPVLESYTDMQDFLKLDPIHEVDPGVGWPRPADG